MLKIKKVFALSTMKKKLDDGEEKGTNFNEYHNEFVNNFFFC